MTPDLAVQLSKMPAGSVASVLRCVVGAGEQSLQDGIYEERQAVLRNRDSKNKKEGMMAFIEKRKPVFNRE